MIRRVQRRSGPRQRVGLFSTLTGAGSRALVTNVATACRDGVVPDTAIAFLMVNRAPGESALTDSAVEFIQAEFDVPVVRASAVGFGAAQRKAARRAEAQGAPAPLEAWRDAFYASYSRLLPESDVDLLLGDMWIWGPDQCAERRGLNLHPALPGGPAGVMWFDAIWDLVSVGATESGVMVHRVTPAVDLGPVATFCRYQLRGPELDSHWNLLPEPAQARAALIQAERARRRDSTHPLFVALREVGLRCETPLLLATLTALAEGRLALERGGVVDGSGRALPHGLDLTTEVLASASR